MSFKDIEKYVIPCSKYLVLKRAGDSGEILECFMQGEDTSKKKAYYGSISIIDEKWIVL